MKPEASMKGIAKHFSWWVVVPIALFIIHTVLLSRDWIIDDAGISFAYAKNLPDGYGLVPHKGNR